MSTTLNVPRRARHAWARLLGALDDADRRDQLIPCRTAPSTWWATDREARAFAAAQCATCPALHACHDYATIAGERAGVWGGTDRTGAPPAPTTPTLDLDEARRLRAAGHTYRAIADQLDASPATVARALADHPGKGVSIASTTSGGLERRGGAESLPRTPTPSRARGQAS